MLAAAVVGIVIVAGGGSGGAKGAAASTSAATATITRQDLVQIDSESGTLGYGGARTVVNRLSGTITWLPAVGGVVRDDHVLFRVDNKPVILLDGAVPAYRALQAGASAGPDVAQLQRDLRAGGYDPSGAMTLNDQWSAATTAAVKRWQSAHGLGQTGAIELGRVVFQVGPRRVANVSATLGGTGASGGGSPSRPSGASYRPNGSAPRLELVDYTPSTTPTATTPTATGTTPTTPNTANGSPGSGTNPGSSQPPAKRKPRSNAPSASTTPPAKHAGSASRAAATRGTGNGSTAGSPRNSANTSSAGSGGASATAIMTTTSTDKVVTVALDVSKQTLAKIGASVSVQLPASNYVRGHISAVGRVATASSSGANSGNTSGSSGSSGATINVTIALNSQRNNALDKAPVSVNFQQSRARNVLAIPVTALLALPGNSYGVEVVSGKQRRVVPVTTGLYTSGYVQIDGPGLQPGMQVTNASD